MESKTIIKKKTLSLVISKRQLKLVRNRDGEEWTFQTDINKVKSNTENEDFNKVEDNPVSPSVTEKLFLEANDDKTQDVSECDEWVIKQQLCRCCLTEGTFPSLFSTVAGDGVSYDDMLMESLNIQLFPVSEDVAGALRGVCGLCAARMRDAHAFCQQVHASDAHFRALYARNCITVVNTVVDVDVELEIPDADTGAYIDEDDNFALGINENSSTSQLAVLYKVGKPGVRRSQRTRRKKQRVSPPSKPVPKKKNKTGLWSAAAREYLKVGNQFKCTRCEITRTTPRAVVFHFNKVHLKLDPYQCDHCGNRSKTRTRLTIHKLQDHNIDDRFKCGACDLIFNLREQLTRHISSYHKLGELRKCPKCDYECHHQRNLSRHMDKHKTTKDHCCKYCKKSFLRSRTLLIHERIHTGDKRKVCSECGQAFVQKASLNYHMAKYHPGVKF